jgi:hypothetical protein
MRRLVIMASAAAVSNAAGQTVSFTLAAKSDRTYPTLPAGATITSFDPYPAIGADGAAAFGGVLSSSNQSRAFMSTSQGPVVRASGGDPAPGGGAFIGFLSLVPLSAGRLAFTGDAGPPRAGCYSSTSAGVVAEVLVGQALPGIPPGSAFSMLGLDTMAHTERGLFFLGGFAPNPQTPVDTGLWAERDAQPILVARTGAQAPGLPAGTLFPSYAFSQVQMALTDDGRIMFDGNLPTSTGRGIWAGAPDDPQLVVAPGLPVPWGIPGNNAFVWALNPMMNGSGEVAFVGAIQDASNAAEHPRFEGVWLWHGGALENIALAGQPAPGTGARFSQFFGSVENSVALGDHDWIALGARLAGPGVVRGVNDLGLWVGRPGSLRLAIRTGDTAPGYPAGTTLQYLSYPFTVNGHGQMLFHARTSASTGNEGLFYVPPYGATQRVLHGTQAITPPGSGPLTVSQFSEHFAEAGAGRPAWINDAGQFVVWASFTSGGVGAGSGIVVGSLPDPCYGNCDHSTVAPVLNIADFVCFQGEFAAGDTAANCDGSTGSPVLTVNDFVCFMGAFAAGCP